VERDGGPRRVGERDPPPGPGGHAAAFELAGQGRHSPGGAADHDPDLFGGAPPVDRAPRPDRRAPCLVGGVRRGDDLDLGGRWIGGVDHVDVEAGIGDRLPQVEVRERESRRLLAAGLERKVDARAVGSARQRHEELALKRGGVVDRPDLECVEPLFRPRPLPHESGHCPQSVGLVPQALPLEVSLPCVDRAGEGAQAA